MGIEPTNKGFADLCLTARLPHRPPPARKAKKSSELESVVRPRGFGALAAARGFCVGIVEMMRGLKDLVFK